MRGWCCFAAMQVLACSNAPPASTASSDGGDATVAAASCVSTVDCAKGLVCGYAFADECSAKGVCIVSDCASAGCEISPAGVCGCNGSGVIPVSSGYFNAPANGEIGDCSDRDAQTDQ